MRAFVVLMAAILLFGCAQQELPATGSESNGTDTRVRGGAGSETVGTENRTPGAGNVAPTQNTTGVLMADYKPPEIPHFDFSDQTDAGGRLIVYYFHSSGCSACTAIQPEIDRLRTAYPEVVWMDYDLATANGSYAYRNYAAQLNLSPGEMLVPQALVNGTIITDRFRINATLEGMLRNFTSS